MDPSSPSSHIVIARIVRTRGNRGEVLAELHTDFPERFSQLGRVRLEFPDGRRECRSVESSWEHKGRYVLKFSSIDSIAEAEALVGAWVEVESGQAARLPDGSYWDHDLIGCSVVDGTGLVLGAVADVLRIAGNSQLVVKGARGEFLVPAVAPICREVSIARKVIVVDLPEGLLDLNE